MNKKSSGLSKFKDLCVERLWLVLLLTPLLVIAVIMDQHFRPSERQSVNRGIAMVVGSVEISTAELAAIVAKPLSELIAMEVYSVANNGSVVAASIGKKELRQVTYSRLSEIKRADNNPISVISYAITEQTKTRIIRDAS